MRIYVDTGVFIDYLWNRSHLDILRTKGRNKRPREDLSRDSLECLDLIRQDHDGFTSIFSYYEIENTYYRRLIGNTRGISNRRDLIVMASRPVNFQLTAVLTRFELTILSLTNEIINQHQQNNILMQRGIRTGDSIHIATAIEGNIDLIISTDRDIKNLDNQISNKNGLLIRCLDTDIAKNELRR